MSNRTQVKIVRSGCRATVALFLAHACSTSAGQPVFPELRLGVDNQVGIATADFDGDDVPDLALADGEFLRIFRGNGDGSFLQWVVIEDDRREPDLILAVADLNADGRPDLWATPSSAMGRVFLNQGDGIFERRLVNRGDGEFLTLADFNSDSVPDACVVERHGTFKILLANGEGVYELSGWNPGSPDLGGLDSADVNADGLIDLVATFRHEDELAVFLGNGDGTFQDAIITPTGEEPTGLVIMAVNSDGIPDVAVGIEDGIALLVGAGDGRFGSPAIIPVGEGREFALATGDVDGDGNPDLSVLDLDARDPQIRVLRGDGEGNFALSASKGTLGDDATSLIGADLNADGRMDHFLTGNDDVHIVITRDDGSLHAARFIEPLPRSPTSWVAARDLNNDGVPDLLAKSIGDAFAVLLGRGDGTFQEAVQFGTGTDFTRRYHVADFNGDGTVDLVVGHATSGGRPWEYATPPFALVMLGDGEGTFLTGPRVELERGPRLIESTDLTGDGVPDLVFVSDLLSTAVGNGDGSFQGERVYGPVGSMRATGVGDLNADGLMDLAIIRLPNVLAIYPGLGDGGFDQPTIIEVGDEPGDMQIADLNGDGLEDIAVTNTASEDLSVLLAVGDGSLEALPRLDLGARSGRFALADLDGDSLLDIAVTQSGTVVFHGVGDGTFQRFTDTRIDPGQWYQSPFAVDIDLDGDQDLVGIDQGQKIVILQNLRDPCRADIDGDGDADAEDFFAYLDAFSSGDLDVCDIDTDADCDAKDFFAFLDQFADGC